MSFQLYFFFRMAFYLDSVLSCTRVLMRAISGWIVRHFIGAVLVSLPALTVYSHFTCDMYNSIQVEFSLRNHFLAFVNQTFNLYFNSSFAWAEIRFSL